MRGGRRLLNTQSLHEPGDIHSLVLGVRPALLRIFSFYIKADMYLPSVTQSNIIDLQLLLLRFTVENPAETG
jgi:hypothetical protein